MTAEIAAPDLNISAPFERDMNSDIVVSGRETGKPTDEARKWHRAALDPRPAGRGRRPVNGMQSADQLRQPRPGFAEKAGVKVRRVRALSAGLLIRTGRSDHYSRSSARMAISNMKEPGSSSSS